MVLEDSLECVSGLWGVEDKADSWQAALARKDIPILRNVAARL